MTRLKAVILDWAGTVVDHGSRAPMGAFVRAFAQFGVTIAVADARGPMGMAKWDHIRAVGRAPAGAAAGLKIGSTTGYTRPIMAVLAPLAAAAGYAPDVTVCAGDLPAGRPSPLMMWHAMAALGVWPAETVVKVDDTPPGIGEGIAAGTWTVGLALTGNIAGLSATELAALAEPARAEIRARATRDMRAAGADFVIDSIATLPAVLATIEARLAAGGRPGGGGDTPTR
jgi:phosphonoacetaldehyde hydrolase